ncbi:MAG: hypothetical protein H0W18_08735 [Acidobacteria bacterium]|nr:hypothetical protein [Acidobacteriota bacterium]
MSVALVPLLVFVASLTAAVRSQESQSSLKATAVAKLLDTLKLDAVAAIEDQQTGRFAAALYYPGTQLLVVSAVHPQPDVAAQRLAERKYRDVYLDLQGSATRKGRLFVLDLEADGLKRTREGGAAFDQTYIDGANQISYDGDWKTQKMTPAQYDERFQRDDKRYAEILAALEHELTRQAGTAR